MNSQECNRLFQGLSTPLVADACIRLKLGVRSAPSTLTAIFPGSKVAGRALPTRHYGSVDIFLEAMLQAKAGDILCIDDRGRTDQACIGDLTALEAQSYGIAAMLVWGCHRDHDQLLEIGLPIFSYGRQPAGPQKLEQRDDQAIGMANFGIVRVTADDWVFIDSDGAVFVHGDKLESVLTLAAEISAVEKKQAQTVRDGINLHTQLDFADYMQKRLERPSYTFREHLRARAKSIEE